MQLEHSFTVPVGIDEAWGVLTDIERIAPCMPGAAVDSVDGDDFTGTVKVKLGPIGLTYKGKASFLEKDPVTHRAVINAQGRDARGAGTAAAKVTAVLTSDGGSTKVVVTTDLDITGKPAQFGRGVMVDVGNKLIGQFADCLAGQLSSGSAGAAGATPAAPAPAATGATVSAAADGDPAAPVEVSAEVPADLPAEVPAAAGKAPARKAPAKKTAGKQVAAAASSPATATAQVNGAAAASESAASVPAAEAAESAAAIPGVAAAAAAAETANTASEPGPAAEPAAPPAPARSIPPREVEPIDLMQSAGPAVAKRLAPLVGGVVLLLILLRVLRRR